MDLALTTTCFFKQCVVLSYPSTACAWLATSHSCLGACLPCSRLGLSFLHTRATCLRGETPNLGARLLCSRLPIRLPICFYPYALKCVCFTKGTHCRKLGSWEGYVLQSLRLLCSRLLTSVLSGARRSWEGYVLQRSAPSPLSPSRLHPLGAGLTLRVFWSSLEVDLFKTSH